MCVERERGGSEGRTWGGAGRKQNEGNVEEVNEREG